MSYSQFRTNVACPIKQEYSGEKNEQNQIVINFLALCSHINFSLSETPTFKDFKSCIVLWLPLLWLCKAKYFCHSVAIIIFLIWSRLSFHTCAFLFFFIQKNSFLLFCSNCNFYLSLFLFAALAPIGKSWCPDLCLPCLTGRRIQAEDMIYLHRSQFADWIINWEFITPGPKYMMWYFGAPHVLWHGYGTLHFWTVCKLVSSLVRVQLSGRLVLPYWRS